MSLISEKELEGTLTEYQTKIKIDKENPNWKKYGGEYSIWIGIMRKDTGKTNTS